MKKLLAIALCALAAGCIPGKNDSTKPMNQPYWFMAYSQHSVTVEIDMNNIRQLNKDVRVAPTRTASGLMEIIEVNCTTKMTLVKGGNSKEDWIETASDWPLTICKM